MTTQPRFVDKETKRHLCSELLDDFIGGDNALAKKFGRGGSSVFRLSIQPADREALLDRIVREPNHDPDIVDLTNGLITSVEPMYRHRLTGLERKMLNDWRTEQRVSLLRIYCRCFSPPEYTGWPDFYHEFSYYLLNGDRNKRHLHDALKQKLPIEVTYTRHEQEIIRFHVLVPYPADQEGARIVENPK